MKPEDIHKTAFCVLPLRNSPHNFQRVLNIILGNVIGKICFVFIDIIIFGETVEEANMV